MKAARKYFLIALAVVVVDQVSKLIVKFNMDLNQEIRLLGDLFKLHFIENKGAAFGLTITKIADLFGGEMSEETGKLILSLFSIVAVFAIAFVLFRLADHRSPLPYFVALIFGGALGNIIDRTFYGVWFSEMNVYHGGLFHGRVVDMFYLDIGDVPIPDFLGGGYYHLWPIFNVADSAISIGIVVLLIFQGKFFKMDDKARQPQEAEANTNSEAETPAT